MEIRITPADPIRLFPSSPELVLEQRFNCDLVGVHFPSGTAVSPTLISMERHAWLYHQHQIQADSRSFDRDFVLVALMARYHPRSKTPNPQGRELKLSNQWALPYELTRAIHECASSPPMSPLNCSMADGMASPMRPPSKTTSSSVQSTMPSTSDGWDPAWPIPRTSQRICTGRRIY